MKKELISYINTENMQAEEVLELAGKAEHNGMDALFVCNYSSDDASRDEFLHICRKIKSEVDLTLYIGYRIMRFEDGKKAFYTGAEKLVVPYDKNSDFAVISSVTERFGKDRVFLEIDAGENSEDYLYDVCFIEKCTENKIAGLMLEDVYVNDLSKNAIAALPFPALIADNLEKNSIEGLMSLDNVYGVATGAYADTEASAVKKQLKDSGIEVKTFEANIRFSDLKKNSDGLVPVVVQDYRNLDVLMVAYMNEEAFNATLTTGRMTYFSRSRQELWEKGLTSGHFQYLKELKTDCDSDTLLAKVKQIGAACHTGSRSCFFKDIADADFIGLNPLTVLSEDYKTILDRKANPKPGSYTNYLFDKGIDKILKKCGEEATEMVIAAKNPDKEEIRYEIADFLYHMMVLMVECNVDWDDIVRELANRRT